MGFCTAPDKKFIVTDNKNIKISNLNREFLFRKKDVGKSKSEMAIKYIQEINPSFKAKALQEKFCEETEETFNEDFFSNLNFIIYAVDSVQERNYIDSKVIIYRKIAVDSNVKGTQAQSQIIIPFRTVSYQDIAPPIEIEIPQGTLRHIDYTIQHCIEKGHDYFCNHFRYSLNDLKYFFTNLNEFKVLIKREGSSLDQLIKLEYLKKQIEIIVTKDIKKMCQFGIDCFSNDFDNNIQNLLNIHPPDYKITLNDKIVDFWSGSRRLPHPIKFDVKDNLCISYVMSFVKILSHVFGITLSKEELSKEIIQKICTEISKK